MSAAGGPRLSRPHPRRAAVPAPDYSRTSRAEGGPPGTSAPTILPPAPIRPRRWPHDGPATRPPRHGLACEVPAPPPARGVRTPPARRAKYPRRPRRGTPTLSHPMRPSHARPARRETRRGRVTGLTAGPPHARPVRRETPPKNLKFFCHRRMPVAYIHVSGFARICAAPNKTRGIWRFGRRVRRVYFFSRPPCAHGGCVVYSWRL